MTTRWAIWIDIEGFSHSWAAGPPGGRDVGELLLAVYRIGSRHYGAPGRRVFAHHLGDGVLIIGDTTDTGLLDPIAVGIALMRHLIVHGIPTKVSIVEGSFMDVSVDYPRELVDACVQGGTVPMGHGQMSIMQVMGSAVIDAVRLSNAESGPLLLVPLAATEILPHTVEWQRLENGPVAVVDWIRSEPPCLEAIQDASEFELVNPAQVLDRVRAYCDQGTTPAHWAASARRHLRLQDV